MQKKLLTKFSIHLSFKRKKKALQKVGTERNYFNIIKIIHDKPMASIVLYGEKLKAFPVRSEIR